MKIHVANYQERTGGGWSFARYFVDHFGQSSIEECDIYFIAGATQVERDNVQKAKNLGKKIVLRVDNYLLPSRNRNTGMSRMVEYAALADLVIYQSEYAYELLNDYLGTGGPIILNGVDKNTFKPMIQEKGSYLYVRSSRNESKGWEMARHWFEENFQDGMKLYIVGKFGSSNLEYNFDFYKGEAFEFMGEVSQDIMASVMSRTENFLYSYFADCCSNTLLEAKASGCNIVDVYGMLKTGGAPEIMKCGDISIQRCMKEYEEHLRWVLR